MIKFAKWKVPPTGGQARRKKLLVSWGPLVIAAPLAGSLLSPLRCAAPCQRRPLPREVVADERIAAGGIIP